MAETNNAVVLTEETKEPSLIEAEIELLLTRNDRNKHFNFNILTFIFIYSLLTVLLFFPKTIGEADNGDYLRTMEVFGILPIENTSYFSFQNDYVISNPKSVSEYGIDIFKTVKYSPSNYYSSQFLFVKVALFVNAVYNAVTETDANHFNLTFQTLIYIFCYSLAVTAFFKRKWLSSIPGDWVFKIVFLILFFDTGYLMYFNSFFGESTTFIFLVASFILLLILEKQRENDNRLVIYTLLIFSIWAFSGSKTANFPSAILLSAVMLINIIKRENSRRKIILSAAIVIMLINAFGYVNRTPEWMSKVTTYQSVFYGILKDTADTDEILKELNLPPELAKLECTTAYTSKDYDIYGVEFEKLFYDNIDQTDILKYYLRHPNVLIEKLNISAEAALPLRATYLSNYDINKEQDLVFANKFNIWESVRKHFSGYAFEAIILIVLLSVVNLTFHIKRKSGICAIVLRMAFICCAMGQFVVPIIGNGEADLMKHMFLFNAHLDILVLLLFYDNLAKCFIHYKITLTVIAIFVIAGIVSFVARPKPITFGNLDGQPIEWYVIDEKDGFIKLISKDILCISCFDENSNHYLGSVIEKSLNSKKEDWFTASEQSQIKKAKYSLVLSVKNVEMATSGNRLLYWFSGMEYAEQNIDRAYRCTYFAYISLPSVSDVKQLHELLGNISNVNEQVWLQTPYSSQDNFSRVAAPDNQIYHRNVKNELGIRPVVWVSCEVVR